MSATPRSRGELLLDRMAIVVRGHLPRGVSPAYLDGFLHRNRRTLVEMLDQQLAGRPGAAAPPPSPIPHLPAPLSVGARTEANLRALEILARGGPRDEAERQALTAYSGWGGLSLAKATPRLPPGLPAPMRQGLLHEYYTPRALTEDVADAIAPLLPSLPLVEGRLAVLEPSAGVGNFLYPLLERWPAEALDISAAEYSPLSAAILKGVFPGIRVVEGPFEALVAQSESPRFSLVLSNPPYGPRGATRELDTHPDYDLGRAYVYFLRRGLDLLLPGGLGVFLIPTGFLSSASPEFRRQREAVLRRHHLLAAFRLPSTPAARGDAVIFEGFVTDLLFLRRRPGVLAEVLPEDGPLLEGAYFDAHPSHILGTPVGVNEGWEPGMPKVRRGYQVVGAYDGLPALEPRPMGSGELEDPSPHKALRRSAGGVARIIRDAGRPLDAVLDLAVRLGLRADAFLAALAQGRGAALAGWAELKGDLLTWAAQHGDPQHHKGLRVLGREGVTGAQRFIALWGPRGLTPALADPPKVEARYQGDLTLPRVADWLYRQRGGSLTIGELGRFWGEKTGARLGRDALLEALLPLGWCVNGPRWEDLHPASDYYTGYLWDRFDRAAERAAQGDSIARAQAQRLREAIGWKSGPEILKDCLPIDAWLPLDLVAEWVGDTLGTIPGLSREDGLLQVEGRPYGALNNTDKRRSAGLTRETLSFIGWANLDPRLWRPERRKVSNPATGAEETESVKDARARHVAEESAAWQSWVAAEAERLDRLEAHYNRHNRGFVEPTDGADPVEIARWHKDIRLHDYQSRALRKLHRNRSGLLAFDVGLGKTYTGIALLALARQEGWARRPVIVVPNSIVWKWYRDIERCLPDYRVLVVGSERKVMTRGARKGRIVAVPDSAEARAAKWTRFQAGDADVVILAYSVLAQTQISPAFVERYVNGTVALRRSIALSLARDEDGKGQSERQEVEMEERIRGWIGQVLQPTKGRRYDPGIDWHQLGVDLLMVDEAQNFKNLFYSARDLSKPDTKRAWALDFRCASVREHSGGAGVVLLSATPAKNNPVELYTMLHYLHPGHWGQVGIDNHEAFLNRFGDFEARLVLDAAGQRLVPRDVMVRYKNLDELRGVLFRWSEFKVAEEVGLKLPEVLREVHYVDASDAQLLELEGLYSLLADIEERIVRAGRSQNKGAVQALIKKKAGLAFRIYLTYLHPALPAGAGEGDEGEAEDKATRHLNADPTEGPKLVACADAIRETSALICPVPEDADWCLACGHIVFCDNIAVHGWMKQLLVARGFSAERIAILNGQEASDIEYRQQVVERFNGAGRPEDEDYSAPALDIVIANAVAYEGVDLQRRTCAIHHLDVPWEPATLQQRNGRGVRQGNLSQSVTLHYYFVRGSNEAHRVQKIERKRGWMASVIEAQARATNTTQEEDLSAEEVADLSLTHAPPEVRARIERAKREQEVQREGHERGKAQEAANRDLRQVNLLFRRAQREKDPLRAQELESSAEAALQALARYPAELWPFPFFEGAARVREGELFVPRRGPALRPGDRLTIDGARFEVGRLGVRAPARGKPVEGLWLRPWGSLSIPDRHHLPASVDLMSEDVELELSPDWPPEDWASLTRNAGHVYGDALRLWRRSGWDRLAPETQERLWPGVARTLGEGFHAPRSGDDLLRLPFVKGGRLGLMHREGVSRLPPGGSLIPPTEPGWVQFLAAAPLSELSFSELDGAARYWWGRGLPRDLLATARRAGSAQVGL